MNLPAAALFSGREAFAKFYKEMKNIYRKKWALYDCGRCQACLLSDFLQVLIKGT